MTAGAAGCATNSLHVAVLPGQCLESLHAAFERFGDVLSVKPLSDEVPCAVTVTFFDVRAVELCMEALGREYCQPGPQHGCRTVQLPGDVQLSSEDFAKISGVFSGANEDGAFSVQFFDIRDAERCGQTGGAACPEPAAASAHPTGELGVGRQAPVRPPPGLECPPGLDEAEQAPACQGVAPPPGLEDLAAPEGPVGEVVPVCQVSVTGLPNKLLQEAMMEAVLQQAGFEGAFLSFSSQTGKPSGTVLITFASFHAAERCARHFSGCEWDKSGVAVAAVVEPVGLSRPRTESTLSAEAAAFEPCGLSASAPPFKPSCLSAEAPAFLPAAERGLKPGVSSDTSTEVGESEAEDGGSPWPVPS